MTENRRSVKQKIAENVSRLKNYWWRFPCLCVMCHQNRRTKPGATASIYDQWCDECFSDLPLWLRFEKATREDLEQLERERKEAKDKRREKREEKARQLAGKTKKKVKLTGFENVEDEEETGENKDVNRDAVADGNIDFSSEEQREKLESIFYYQEKNE